MHGRGEPAEKIAQEAAGFVQEGFKSLKIRLAPRTDTLPGDHFLDVQWPLSKQIASVKAVRKAVGNDVEILVDANGGFTVSQAIRVAQQIERYEIGHFEEPVPSWDFEGLAEVRRAISIPVASGENLYTRYEFKELINRRAVEIVQPDLILAGGLSECKKIAVLADVQGMLIRPHNGWAHIGLAATMHFAASTPNCRGYQEYSIEYIPLREEGGLLKEPLRARDGYVEVPQKPGLGIDVDDSILEKYGIK
jgi:L-alanine-DL-glutamate epimerase-like enolase superfamily enzyme